ncbi:flagellar export protein FliJ [Salinibacillus xinjiangensis]|uniref:Flagellar FliJ protein n=1 Tax=Salinibacillus xinjiangensis TaxID=1229268 RepID=A0A6G1X3A1_9BACI|nr:flagellar export protein FliJ [Salinibacillus xinjiangensis]MRG85399.1 flagellar export protein FliJ [Salinibacillus xinjiangensis]
MTNVQAFERILNVRTTEKDMAYKTYQDAMDHFEVTATELYHFLKEKEDLEKDISKGFQSSISAEQIRNYHSYMQSLNSKIAKLQQAVLHARQDMESSHDQLTERYVEMKKYEKIITHKKNSAKQVEVKKEKELLDEASIQQFLRRGNR